MGRAMTLMQLVSLLPTQAFILDSLLHKVLLDVSIEGLLEASMIIPLKVLNFCMNNHISLKVSLCYQ